MGVLNILGAGYAYPETVIDNPLLEALGAGISAKAIEASTGILTRRSVLNPDYLRETRNAAVNLAEKNYIDSPSTLGLRAAEMAIARAGIQKEQIGLVIGDAVTPLSTTPAEGQRVANRLGIKVPAYDVTSGTGSLPTHFSIMSGWKVDRAPEYILCISSNTPTMRVNYQRGLEMLYFGDAACAFICSLRHHGKMRVKFCVQGLFESEASEYAVNHYGHMSMHSQPRDPVVMQRLDAEWQKLLTLSESSGGSHNLSSVKFIGAPLDLGAYEEFVREKNIAPKNSWSNVARCGHSLGSALGVILAERWDELQPGDKVVAAFALRGFGTGAALLEV